MSTERETSDLIYGLSGDKVLCRLNVLHQIYLKKIEPHHPGAHLNLKLLRHTVESYMLDMERMKTFHDIKYSDRHKRAAFSMYWIAKIKPIQRATDANMTKALILVNEAYAIHAGIGHLDASVKNISADYLRNLLYTLHYRHVPPEALALDTYLLECAANKKTP